MPELEIVPAVLAKTPEDLLARVERVQPYVKTIQIDIMDGRFVPNTTIGLDALVDLPGGVQYEFHWMVQQPERWIEQVPGPHLHIPHIEAITSFDRLAETTRQVGGKLGIAFNPGTPLEKVQPYQNKVNAILAMTVHPGYSGQKYIPEVEEKIRALRRMNRTIDIEVDGGINLETIGRAVRAGANRLGAASAIFDEPDTKIAIERLRETARAALETEEAAWLRG